MRFNQIICGDIREIACDLPSEQVNCIVTSPPYWGLRDYGEDNQLGLESTPEEYVNNLVSVFRELKRVLREDGTLWLNLGDSYASQGGPEPAQSKWKVNGASNTQNGGKSRTPGNLKPKDLVGIPWRVALALQADGWYLRSDIIWSKPNPMPESVTDRPTKSHEYLFLLAKSQRYYYDADAIREPAVRPGDIQTFGGNKARNGSIPETDPRYRGGSEQWGRTIQSGLNGRNKRTVWEVPTRPYKEAHFATFPPDLILPCILAGCPIEGVVLDPFFGTGSVAQVAIETGRQWLGVELNESYIKLAEKRIAKSRTPLPGIFGPKNNGQEEEKQLSLI